MIFRVSALSVLTDTEAGSSSDKSIFCNTVSNAPKSRDTLSSSSNRLPATDSSNSTRSLQVPHIERWLATTTDSGSARLPAA